MALAAGLLLPSLLPAPARALETGVNLVTFPPPERLYGNVHDVRTKWIRVFNTWARFEPSKKGEYADMTEYDAGIDRAASSGWKVMMVVTGAPKWASGSGDGITPPRNPQDYADYLAFLAGKYKGKVQAYEIWNEADDSVFWKNGPEAARYTQLLQAAHTAIKAEDSKADVYTTPLVGNNYGFLEAVYDNGGKGSFDGVAVHTDTACNLRPPGETYREADGRLGRFSFTGYREVRSTMVARGDASKKIAMSEFGWSTSAGLCDTGPQKNKKPGGVSEAQQAQFVGDALTCMAHDSYMSVAQIFSLQDVSDQDVPTSHKFGLMRANFSNKPAYDMFKSYNLGPTPGPFCGGKVDSERPTVTLEAPTEGRIFNKFLPIEVRAKDDARVNKIQVLADGRNIPVKTKRTDGGRGASVKLSWQGARKLGFGQHTITARALDDQQNKSEASVLVTRINTAKHPVKKSFMNFKVEKLDSKAAVRTVRGSVVNPQLAALSMVGFGKVKVEFQNKRVRYRTKDGQLTNRNKKGRKKVRVWVTVHKFSKPSHKPFKFGARMRFGGEWRARAVYSGKRPFGRARSSWMAFRVSSKAARKGARKRAKTRR